MKFNLKLNQSEVKKARQEVIASHAKKIQLKGFRAGKAPLKLVEEKIGEKIIVEDILDRILPKAYADVITQKKLKPISMPKITPTSIKNDQDWEFEVEIAEKPEVKLGEYQKYVKDALKKVEKNSKKDEEMAKKDPEHDPKLVAIFDALLDKVSCEVSELLIDEEVNNQLSKLVNQIQKLGLSLEKYLETMKISFDDLKKQYHQSAHNNLKLEFILQALIVDQKIKVENKEIDDLINSIGDEHTKTHLNTPRERQGIEYMLAKQKVVEFLKNI